MMNSIKQMLETKNFLAYFIINWFLQPAVGCSLFLLDILVRVMIHLLESTLSSAPPPPPPPLPKPVLKMCLIRTPYPRLYWRCAWFVLHILACTEDVPCSYCTSSLVLKMWFARTAHPHSYWRSALLAVQIPRLHWCCARFVRHILACTEDVPDSYCTSSLVLKMCLIRTAHPRLYWRCAWFVLHILACTEDVPDSYCTSSLVLQIIQGVCMISICKQENTTKHNTRPEYTKAKWRGQTRIHLSNCTG